MRGITFWFQFCLNSILLLPIYSIGQSQRDLLLHWAPEVYQDMNSSQTPWWQGGRQFYTARDALVKFDFDSDLNTGNNWHNSRYQTWEQGLLNDRLTPPLYGISYTSCVETRHFYFLGYGFYHAGDDSNIDDDRHENDWEMILLCIKKDNQPFGSFQAMITQFHKNHLEYEASELQWNGSHPKIYISANGVFALPSPHKYGHGIECFTNQGYQAELGENAIIYSPEEYNVNVRISDIPGENIWSNVRVYPYTIISINELWNRRNNNTTYSSYTTFQGGDSDIKDGGNPPWTRQYFHDPIEDFKTRDKFNFLNQILNEDTYIYNPYFGNNATQHDNNNPNEIVNFPQNWLESALGSGSGKLYYHRQTFTIDGKGSNIGDTSDHGYYIYKNLTGDVEIIARIYSVQNIHASTKAGVMIRESIDPKAKFVYMQRNPAMNISFEYRMTNNNKAVTYPCSHTSLDSVPVYLKIKREGDLFTGMYSTDGTHYIQAGKVTISMAEKVMLGLAVTSHDPEQFACAGMDKVITSQSVNNVWPDKKGLIFTNSMKIVIHDSQIIIDFLFSQVLFNSQIYLYQADGRLVRKVPVSALQSRVILDNLHPAIYFLRVTLFNKTYLKKLMVN